MASSARHVRPLRQRLRAQLRRHHLPPLTRPRSGCRLLFQGAEKQQSASRRRKGPSTVDSDTTIDGPGVFHRQRAAERRSMSGNDDNPGLVVLAVDDEPGPMAMLLEVLEA